MRASDKERERPKQQLLEFRDREEFFDSPSEPRLFSSVVEEQIQWIEANEILGTWGGQGQDIKYDKNVFGERCTAARKECQYSEKMVARLLSYKTHTYLSGLEQGSMKLNIFTLELLALLYHKTPKYLLGLEDAGPISSMYYSEKHKDYCEYLVLNSLFAPQLFDCPTDQVREVRLKYINAVIKLSRLPDCTICALMEIAARVPALKKTAKVELKKNKFYKKLRSPQEELLLQYEDYSQRIRMIEVYGEILNALNSLCEHNPEWLIFIAQVIAKQPDLIFLVQNIVEQGGFVQTK